MADLGKSQIRQAENLGNSPTGQTGSPTGSRGNSYRSAGSQLDPLQYPSRDTTLASPGVTPAGSGAPFPSKGGQHYVEQGSPFDADQHISRSISPQSPAVTPAGSGSTEATSGGGQHYAAPNSTKDRLNRTGHSSGLFGGKSGTGATQGDTGQLPITSGGPTTYYLMRARDPDCVSQPTYRFWTVTGTPDMTGSLYTGPRCGVSPLVEIVVEITWKQ